MKVKKLYSKEIIDRFVDNKACYLYEDDDWGYSFNNVSFYYISVQLLRWLIWTETNDMLDDAPPVDFEEVSTFFETMPKLIHSIQVKNPKTKKKGEVLLEGIASFF